MREWTAEHWLLTALILYSAMTLIYRVLVRLVRMVVILFRGWPPAHLDADGDWRPAPENKEGT